MMKSNKALTLACDLDKWNGYEQKVPITTDISPSTNSHMLICGMSGGGKSYAELGILAKLVLSEQDSKSEYYFADYKGDDSFGFLRDCPKYYSYKNTLEALDIVYDKMNARLAGNTERTPVTLIWDEYMANILALNVDKKHATEVMNKVSEILLMGRSMSIRLITSMQRADSIAFSAGSRLNYGVVMILGAAVRSIYEMLMPDFMEQVKGREFGRGEGVVLLQGSELHFIKVGVHDDEKVHHICKQALS